METEMSLSQDKKSQRLEVYRVLESLMRNKNAKTSNQSVHAMIKEAEASNPRRQRVLVRLKSP